MENTVICSTDPHHACAGSFQHAPDQHPYEVWPQPRQHGAEVNTAIEQMTIWRVEKRRVRNAVSGTITPMTSWNTEVSHCPVVTEMEFGNDNRQRGNPAATA